MSFYDKSIEQTLSELNATDSGLSSQEAKVRLEKNGPNALTAAKKKNIFVKFLSQFTDVMIIVLLVAAVVSAVIAIVNGDYTELIDSGIILLIVIVNAIIGVVQENKAENALEALKNLNKPYSKVMRDGEIKSIPTEEIVVGDIVILEAGDVIPADIRLLTSASLKIDESALTGESVPVEKDAELELPEKTLLGDRKNMAFSGGSVAYGRGTGVVVAVGMDTEVGKIAKMLSSSKSESTPLQKQLAKTAKILSVAVLAIALVIFVYAWATNTKTIIDAFMTAVAIAVAAIPEGLPAVVTIVLAMGVQKMSKRNAIIKNLPAVETLGCCEVICSDKTGTLTLNQMTVKETFIFNSQNAQDEELLIRASVLCNDSKRNGDLFLGDPTETALCYYAVKKGMDTDKMLNDYARIDEIPFDSIRKLMTTVNQNGDEKLAYIKGAPDIMLDKCAYIYENGKTRAITEQDKEIITQANKKMAKKALRVLGVAINSNLDDAENNMTFVGLIGMIDPPRPEVKNAVSVCFKAGLRPLMITGDHADTAAAIASEIGILREGDKVITGAEIQKLTDEEFNSAVKEYSVFARVSPEDKVRIVKAYQSFGKIVAMTGDGVNDAPSIKQADIGVGMGITGTEVSKGAADMILTDDNFATIVSSVEEGRKIFANIQKAVQFLLSANIAEVLCLFIATLFLGVEFLTPVLILWVNLVTDSLPALSLGVEKAESDVMNQPPRNSKKSLFAGKTGKDIIIQGIMQTALVMLSFSIGSYVLGHGVANHNVAVTMAFISLCFIQLFHSFNLKSQSHTIFRKSIFDNKWLNLSFIAGAVLILPITLIPALQGVFGTASLTIGEWAIALGCGVAIIPFVEIQKLIENAIEKRKAKKGLNKDFIEQSK